MVIGIRFILLLEIFRKLDFIFLKRKYFFLVLDYRYFRIMIIGRRKSNEVKCYNCFSFLINSCF